MSLESNSLVTVQVAGINLGVFAFKGGGQVEAEDTKFRPGGMQPQISLGGPVGVENVTVRKLFDVQAKGLFHTLSSLVGRADATVAVQPLDSDSNPSGRAHVYTGKLIRVTPPDADSNSNDAAQLEIEVSTNGTIA